MRRIQLAALLCLAACLGATAFQAFAAQRSEAQPASPVESRWRYRSVRLVLEGNLDQRANEQAEKGWELMQIVPVINSGGASVSMQYTMLFRRAADVKD